MIIGGPRPGGPRPKRSLMPHDASDPTCCLCSGCIIRRHAEIAARIAERDLKPSNVIDYVDGDDAPDVDPESELRYVVPGRPVTWARKRLDTRVAGKPRTFTSATQVNAARAHQWAAIAALGPRRARWSLAGAFSIVVTGYWPDERAGDADRLPGCAMDALQGLAYVEDRQVRSQAGHVIADGSTPRVKVVLRRLAVDPVQSQARKRGRSVK